jgi:hypothetical protein
MKTTRLPGSLALTFALIFVANVADASGRDSYVLHFGGNRDSTTMSGSLADFMSIRGSLDGDYLWVRRAGRTYVITDRARLAEVWDYFAPQRRLSPQQKEIAEETKKLEQESDALEDQDDRELTSAERARLDDLHAKERELARRERALDDREEELERIAEKQLRDLVDRAIRSGDASNVVRRR